MHNGNVSSEAHQMFLPVRVCLCLSKVQCLLEALPYAFAWECNICIWVLAHPFLTTMVEHKKLRRLDWAPHEHCMVTACPVGWTLSQALCQNLVEARVACPQPPDSSESRIFWSRIGGNCDHFQNLFWKWSKYIDIKFEYGISTHQLNDHHYFIIFIFFFYLFLNVCLIIYKLYFANFAQHFFDSIIICIKISDVIFTVKFMVIVFLLWNASELSYFNCFEYKLYNDYLHMLKGIKTYICCHKN